MAVRCLVAGFNYPNTGMDLPDCVLDAEQKRDLFETVLPDAQVVFQTDRTRTQYLNDLTEFAESIGVEDTGIWYDSGHGSRVRSNTEPDGWDECLVCMPEPGEPWPPGYYIRDDKVAAILTKARGPVFAMIDRCYSGTVTREMYARGLYFGAIRLPRFYPLDEPRYEEDTTTDGRMTRLGPGVLLHAACREGQLAYSTGRGGAFSLAWNKLWRPGKTWRDMQQAIVPTVLPTNEYPQHPVLYGNRRMRGWVALV